MRSLRILIWHVHGAYLYYLTKGSKHRFYVPYKQERTAGYAGKSGHIPWPDNLEEIPAGRVRDLDLDCIIFQNYEQYARDQHEILSASQRRLPKIYLEHDPPREHPTDTCHPVNDPEILMVHVTHFNQLMWDSQRTPSVVIEHGVEAHPEVCYSGTFEKGVVAVNHIRRRGRRLGYDVYEQVKEEIPLDHIGMGSFEVPGGIGEVLHKDIAPFLCRYRFLFNPVRYTSLGLSVCEAMMCGIPVTGLATTEMASVIRNGENGYVDTNVENLISFMKQILKDPALACGLGEKARRDAEKRFNLRRFHHDWDEALIFATGTGKIFPG